MNHRPLGPSDLHVSTIALGTMSWPGCHYGQEDYPLSDAEYATVREMVAAAIEGGINVLDTAEGYGVGLAEELLGRAIEELGCRDQTIIVSKTGPLLGSQRANGRACDLSAANITRRCDQALERLRTDRIDLYLAHWPDPATPVEETMQAASQLRTEGKIRWFGVSNFDNSLLASALACGPVAANQLPYSLVDRTIDAGKRPFCLEHNVGIMAYSPMAKGVLSGKYDATHLPPAGDYRHQKFHFATGDLPRHLALAQRLREFAPELGCTPAQLALAWVVSQPGLTLAVPGAKSPEQVRLNAAAGGVAIPPAIAAELDRLSAAPIPT